MRRRWLVVGSVVAVLAAGGLVVVVTARPSDPRRGSRAVASAASGPSRLSAPQTAYSITYRVEERPRKATTVSTERDWVRRPFEGRREVRSGAPPGKARQSLAVYRFGQVMLTGQSEATELIATSPSIAANDLRPDATLRDAVGGGLVETRERRRVLGRACQVYRSPRPAAAGHLVPAQPDNSTYTDLCFTRDSLLLEEATFRNGRLVHRRIAVAVSTAPPAASLFVVTGTPLTLKEGGGSVRRVDAASRPSSGTFYQLDAPPEGFDLRERDAVVPPQPQNFTDPGRQDFRIGAVVDTYVRGRDAVFVDQGGTLGGQPPFAPAAEAQRIDLGALGTGEAFLGLDGNEIRVQLADGHYVRVTGSLPMAELAGLARRLTPQPPGTGLVYLEG